MINQINILAKRQDERRGIASWSFIRHLFGLDASLLLGTSTDSYSTPGGG